MIEGRQIRQRIISGQCSREEAEGFIAQLERELEAAVGAAESFSAEAVSATNRLARHKHAAAELIRALPGVAGEDDREARLRLAREALERHESTAGE